MTTVKGIMMISVNLISNYVSSVIYGKVPVSLYLAEWLLGVFEAVSVMGWAFLQ